MDKQAILEQVYEESFGDEIEKIARIPGTAVGGSARSLLRKLIGSPAGVAGAAVGETGKKVGRAYAGSAKGMAEGMGTASSLFKQVFAKEGPKVYGKPVRRLSMAAASGRSALSALGKGGLVLGTAGGVAGAGALGGVAMSQKKK